MMIRLYLTIICTLMSYFTCATINAENIYQTEYQAVSSTDKVDKKLQEKITAFDENEQYIIKHLPSFHQQKHYKENDLNLCQACHTTLPHKKNEVLRTFLNNHSQRIDCLVCHYKTDSEELSYARADQKITAFYQQNELVLAADSSFSTLIQQQWNDGDINDKEMLYHKIHKPLNKPNQRPQCAGCHQENSILELPALGYDPEQQSAIERNIIAKFLSKFESSSVDTQNDGSYKENKPILLRELLR